MRATVINRGSVDALTIVLTASMLALVVAVGAPPMRGAQYVDVDAPREAPVAEESTPA